MVQCHKPALTDGQTAITGIPFEYTLGNCEILVFLNGDLQYEGTFNDYVEVTTTSITFNFPLKAADVVQILRVPPLTVSETVSGFSVSNITEIEFNDAYGFNVVDETSGKVRIDFSSSWNPWYVDGQDTLDAQGEQPIEFVASDNMIIETDLSTNPAQIIFKSVTAAETLTLNDLLDVEVDGTPDNGDVLAYNSLTSLWEPTTSSSAVSKGEITAANIQNGIIYISYVSAGKQDGITDLTFEVRDPDNTQVAVDVPLTEFYGTGVYYGQIDVGLSNPGPHLVQVNSDLAPDNDSYKIFYVTPAQAGGGGSVAIQETTRKFGDSVSFKHIAQTGLDDVLITVYDASDSPILTNQPMIEIGSTGVYKFIYNPSTAGLYTGIMSSTTISSKSVTEVLFETGSSTDDGPSVTISNRVGVGRREDC